MQEGFRNYGLLCREIILVEACAKQCQPLQLTLSGAYDRIRQGVMAAVRKIHNLLIITYDQPADLPGSACRVIYEAPLQ